VPDLNKVNQTSEECGERDGSTGRNAAAKRPDGLLWVLIALLSAYVAAELTPSSYAVVLPLFESAPHWVSLGKSRDVRSDEWAVWTPYIQATVRNQFQRYNQTSPYHEDLRNMNPLPLMDWGLIFKPYFWPFMIVPPSYAYSFFFAFQVFSFIYGYRQLFRRLGISDEWAAGGALLLFFCGYTQYWWTTVGPSLSFFPWVVLAAMLRRRWWQYVLLVYVVVAWIFGLAYPPLIIALGFVAILVCCAFRDEAAGGMKELFLMAGALACAGALVGLYYQDLLAVTMHTVYPGQRRSSSGTESLRLLMGMFAPAFNQDGYRALGLPNICESGVAGSFLPVGAIAFIDYSALRRLTLGRMQLFSPRRAAIIGAGMLLMLAWIFLPVPAFFGKIFLWQFVPARRMLFPAGVLVTLFCLLLLNACGVVLTVPRICGFFAIVLVSIFSSKYVWSLAWRNTPRTEFLILPVFAACTFLAWRRKLTARQAVVYSCVLANIALFGFFNPILSARDIFVSRDTPIIRSLEKMEREDPRGWLVTPGFPGAVLNGLGFRSIQHVLLSPHLRFFREYFPGMPDAEFNHVFNRYAHVRLGTADHPYSPQPDILIVPAARFGADRAFQ
jgi:hypothetical protein